MPIETILKRSFYGVALLLIGAIAYFQARGTAQLLGLAFLNGRAAKGGTPAQTSIIALPTGAPKSGQVIRDRNPFHSATGPLPNRAQVKSQDLRAQVDPADPLSWPDCEGVEVMIITESSDPRWSLATLRAAGDARPHLRRVGDGVAAQQVAFIGYNPRQQAPAVWLEGDGTPCQSMLFRAPAPASVAAAKEEAPSPAPTATPRASAIFSRLRAIPEQKDGKLIGVRLLGIRPESLLGTLGLQSGDRLESINGFEIASPEKALQAYAQLRTAGHLRVRLNRVGRTVEIDLHIS